MYPAQRLEVYMDLEEFFSLVGMHLVTINCTLSDSSNNRLGGGI